MKIKYLLFFLVCLFSSQAVLALDAAVEQRIKNALESIIPGVQISDISETGIKDLYQVVMGTDVVYVSGDGRFALSGELYDIDTRQNITDARKALVRKSLLNDIPAAELIEFAGAKTEHTIYVFTDITCGYCRKLHQDVPVLNENGVAVRYLAYPRAGPLSSGSDQLQAVWCSKDRRKAMTEAKRGKEPKARTCDNPVARHYQLGQDLGVRGTPAIFLEDGRAIPGYYPPDELLNILKN